MNYFSSGKNWQFSLAVAVLLISGITALRAQVPAGSNRPAAVPEGFLITPMGYFHPSCVKELAEGDEMRPDEMTIKHRDGSFDSMPTCAYPHFTADGEKVATDGSVSEAAGFTHTIAPYSGIEAFTIGTDTYAKLSDEWTVPSAPASHDDQVLYFFPSLGNVSPNIYLQPVLGWNSDYKDAWSLASWNCCTKGTEYKSSPMKTATGHQVFGAMQSTCGAGPKECGSWDIVTTDVTTGESTILSNTSSFGQRFNDAVAGALAVYNFKQCGDLPDGSKGSLQFSEIRLLDYDFNVLNPDWGLVKDRTDTRCGFGGSKTASGVTLKF